MRKCYLGGLMIAVLFVVSANVKAEIERITELSYGGQTYAAEEIFFGTANFVSKKAGGSVDFVGGKGISDPAGLVFTPEKWSWDGSPSVDVVVTLQNAPIYSLYAIDIAPPSQGVQSYVSLVSNLSEMTTMTPKISDPSGITFFIFDDISELEFLFKVQAYAATVKYGFAIYGLKVGDIPPPPPTTPEPATLALMGLGLVGVGLARRRMKK